MIKMCDGLVKPGRFYFLTSLITLTFGWSQIGSKNTEVQGNFNKYSNKRYADVWGYTTPDGHEYALIGWTDGVSVVDIEDPNNLREVTNIPGPTSIWHDVKTYKHYAYISSDQGNDGLQIVDLSTLPTKATLLKNVTTHFTVAHNIWIDSTERLLFAASHGTSRVTVLDIDDPENPTFVAAIPGEVHDIWTGGGMMQVSQQFQRQVAFYDISQLKESKIARRTHVMQLNGGISHNTWSPPSLKYMCSTEETVGKKMTIWNIEGVMTGTAPTKIADYIADPGIIAHNCYWEGDYIYISHYGAGLRILDVKDPADPKEVAYHQPGTTSDDFGGSWGLFLWMPSGRVLHGDANTGLWVTYPDPAIVQQPWTQHLIPVLDKDNNYEFKFYNANRNAINFTLPEVAPYQVSLFNTLGKEVKSFNGEGMPGENSVSWDGVDLNNGKYFIKLEQDGAAKFGSFILKE